MSFVLGLDPSVTSFGVGLVNERGEVEAMSALKAASLKGTPRLAWFRAELRDVISSLDPSEDLVVLEGYAYSRVNLTHLGELCGVLKLVLWDAGLAQRTLVVTPGSLKKFVAGKGNAKKDEMRLEAYKRFGLEAKTQDEVEAVSLALFGLHWLHDRQAPGVRLAQPMVPRGNLDALEKAEVLYESS